AGLPKTDIAVDTIDLDPLNKRIDKAAQLWRHFSLNDELNRKSEEYPHSNWTVVSSTGSGGSDLLNENKSSCWESTSADGHTIVFKSNSGEVAVNSFRIHFPDGYNSRVRYVDAYTSADGENWTLGANSVFINNEDDNEVTLPVTIRGEYIKLFFHEQINSHASARLKISTLAFRGDYDLEKIKAVAKEIIDNENALQYYKTEDIARLKYIYANGSCTNVDLLSAEIRRIYRECFPLMYGRASATSYITATKAYLMQNSAGYGFLCADNQNGLVAKGATATTALDYAKGNASATEPLNTWQIIRSDKFENVYIYNIGLKKYLNPEGQNWFSDEPYPFAIGISGKGCSLRSAKQGTAEYGNYLNLNTSLANPFSWGTLNDNARFNLLEDYYLRPDNAEALAVIKKSFTNERLEAAKTRFLSLLDVPEGRIGSIESAETKTRLETLYNGGDVKTENIMEFIEGVENIKLLELDTKNAYKFTSASATSATNLGMTATGLTATTSSSIKPGVIWKMNYSGEGVIVSSQGKSLSMLPKNTTGSPKGGPIPTTTPDNAAKYYLTEKSPGVFNFSDHSYPTYAVGISGSSAASVAAGNAEALWTIDKVKEYTVRTNSVGVAPLYVDFDLIIPEGQEVFAAYKVTADGVIKLSLLKDTIPARTPVLVKGNPSENIVFAVAANSLQTYEGPNRFSGCLFKPSTLKKNEYYVLSTSNGEPKMKRALLSNLVSDNEIYIAKSAEMPDLQYYTFDFDNIIDGICDTPTSTNLDNNNGKIYDLQGRSATASQNGLYIINNKVVKK
ncbi:MAG: discoidin domain-containing protein, partial [Bacteroidaceae bacterium]